MDYLACEGMNWTWYLGVTDINHENKTVTIMLHDRLHNGGDGHPVTIGHAREIENKAREIVAIQGIGGNGAKYTVNNPKHTFEYAHFHD